MISGHDYSVFMTFVSSLQTNLCSHIWRTRFIKTTKSDLDFALCHIAIIFGLIVQP